MLNKHNQGLLSCMFVKKYQMFKSVVGKIMPPTPRQKKKIHAVIPGNWEYIILHGKRDFTDVSGYDSESG